ncbi:hypothetical protein KFK09_028821 [Dendrobium nobile]|uniref:Uncharacterized protein n=1 Tax=Dendrobium nobile TaxID=94219 RepID=A0A8T3A4K6_DENNO|nr:hypothetical protein KFK09_028821 [Dendrobium nobile]
MELKRRKEQEGIGLGASVESASADQFEYFEISSSKIEGPLHGIRARRLGSLPRLNYDGRTRLFLTAQDDIRSVFLHGNHCHTASSDIPDVKSQADYTYSTHH